MAVLLENFINHTMKVEEDEKMMMQAEQRSNAEVLSHGGEKIVIPGKFAEGEGPRSHYGPCSSWPPAQQSSRTP